MLILNTLSLKAPRTILFVIRILNADIFLVQSLENYVFSIMEKLFFKIYLRVLWQEHDKSNYQNS